MTNTVLTPGQVDEFIELGYCTLREAFSTDQAAAARRCVWRRMEQQAGIREASPSTWPEVYDVQEYINDAEVLACFTQRLADAVKQLVGSERWGGEQRWGFWPVNFSYGDGQPYQIPRSGWHVDGNWFRHTLDSPKQGLLILGLFSDISPRCGGTLLALGSHKRTARVLARHPEGMSHLELFAEALSEPLGNFHEVTGAAGDVVLAHPFLFHNRSMNHGGPPRIMSNTEAWLKEPMKLERPNPNDYSILELSIRRALVEPPVPPPGAQLCTF